jgi:predicted HD phosphohydrolase
VIAHHGLFQGYYYYHLIGRDRDARERYRGHPHFQACADFCERWDQTSFDPSYDTLPLEAFEPAVHRLFAKEPHCYD